MPVNDELGKRMKEYYEQIPRTKLMRRTPVVIRVDGKAFHTFTRGFNKPFDSVLIKSMQRTMQYLCENIQGCVLGYTQSDEITLILVDYKKLNSSAWFDYEVQKMCSIAASMATMAFNKSFSRLVVEYEVEHYKTLNHTKSEVDYLNTLIAAVDKGAIFDARVFNIPKEEVTNLVYWRQLDAIRNSIQSVGQANFSHKELQNKTCNDIQNMLLYEKDIKWDNFPTHLKRGSCCVKTNPIIEDGVENHARPHWKVDMNIPIFRDEGREYIEKLINV